MEKSGKTNALISPINHEPDIDKKVLYATDLYEVIYIVLNSAQMIQKRLLSTQMIWMIFITTLKNTIQIKNEKYWLYLMIWLLIRLIIKNIVTEIFVIGRKQNIALVFITQSYFAVPKNVRLNSTHYFIMKIPNKRELQQVPFSH